MVIGYACGDPDNDDGPNKYPAYVVITTYIRRTNGKRNDGCYFTVYTNRTNAADDIKLFSSKDRPKPFVVTVRTKAEWLELRKKHNPSSVGYHITSKIEKTNRRKPNR